jgi:pilus assembly protein CpaB
MSGRAAIVGVLAVVCGISAMVLVQALRRPSGGPDVERVPVVFAAADIKPGESIAEAMLEVRPTPTDQVPEDAIRDVANAIGRAAMTQLDKGDIIRDKKLAEKGAGRGMAALIKSGMRAFTIRTPSFSSSLAGFLLPGNKVDVLMTTTNALGTDDESGGASTATLLQNVEVLAVHTTVNTPTANKIDPDQARSVTLLVTPEDAALLDLGQSRGELHLTLRNPRDTLSSPTKPAIAADLPFARPRPKPQPAPAPAPAPAPVPVPVPAPAPAPVPEPPPMEPFVAEEPEEVNLTIRTLRGTTSGQDILTYTLPPASDRKPRPEPAVPGAPRFAGRQPSPK